MDIDGKNIVVRTRDEILKDLISQAVDRARAERLIQELSMRDMLNEMMTPKAESFRYMNCDDHMDAVMSFLRDMRRPAVKDQIVDGVLAGGWLKGKEGAKGKLRKSIGAHVDASKGKRKRPGEMAGKIKEAGTKGLIGLFDWPDEMFE
jgi:hypothetical protein